ncbi:CRIB domain-containing protein RIC10 [Zea mays]|uniref:CRIB domain-containing protein RIC10 n=1 Tax=Zea mays TaxID=4577 RepID=A0A1D6H5Q0_MAIZE|nr:CRIB domain-containing protein RIC10 [Zea mays]
MACKVKGIFKGLKAFSQIFSVKEHEMEIGCPTDVKHVVHIGWDSAAGGASPSWMNDIMASSDLSSLGNFAALTGTSWVSQGTVTISSCSPVQKFCYSSVQQLLSYDCCVAHFLAKVFGSSCDLASS